MMRASPNTTVVLTTADATDRSRAIHAFINARRTYNRLDWWQPEDWVDSGAWLFAGPGHSDGAMLILPADSDDVHAVSDLHSDTAWLRWCALADGRPASSVMRGLFAQALPRLRAQGMTAVWAIAEMTDWVAPYLTDAGFVRADRMLTYQIALSVTDRWPRPNASVRPINRTDLGELKSAIDLDEAVFDAPWRYGPLLGRAYDQCQVFVVAVRCGHVTGYACATYDGERGHIVRLAVAPAQRGRGLGTAMLRQVADDMRTRGARVLSLNTQISNTASQRLYERLGFHMRSEQPFVLKLTLDQATA